MPNPCGMIDAPRHLLPTVSLSAVLLLSVSDVSAIFRIDVFAIKRFGVSIIRRVWNGGKLAEGYE